MRGRLFTEADGEVGKEHVAVLTHAFAEQQGGLDQVVGKVLRLDEVPYTVVGVLPRDFAFMSRDVRLYTPLAFKPEDRGEDNRYSQNHQEIGRLASGASIAQLQSRLDALNAALRRARRRAQERPDQRALQQQGRVRCRTIWCATSAAR